MSSYRTQAAAAPPSTAASAVAATMALLLPRERRVGSTGCARSAREGLGERHGSGGGSGCRAGACRRAGPRSSASCARARSASSESTSASSGLSGSTSRAYLAVDEGFRDPTDFPPLVVRAPGAGERAEETDIESRGEVARFPTWACRSHCGGENTAPRPGSISTFQASPVVPHPGTAAPWLVGTTANADTSAAGGPGPPREALPSSRAKCQPQTPAAQFVIPTTSSS